MTNIDQQDRAHKDCHPCSPPSRQIGCRVSALSLARPRGTRRGDGSLEPTGLSHYSEGGRVSEAARD